MLPSRYVKHWHFSYTAITANNPPFKTLYSIYIMIGLIDNSVNDSDWDSFLEQASSGQFQQSASWARVKAMGGWHFHRVAYTNNREICGGFQLLWKPMRIGNIGYISKGPVSSLQDPQFKTQLAKAVLQAASKIKLAFLIVQPPDQDFEMRSTLINHGLVKAWSDSIIDTTCMVDLSEGAQQLKDKMRRTTRAEIRQAQRRGITIREGTADDIPCFYELMLRTCERQKARPNPASEATLRELWSLFSAKGQIRLTLAEREKSCVAGLLSMCFGKRVTMWKKGSEPEHFDAHPMALLYWELLDWACRSKFEKADFAGLSRRTASILLSGEKLTEKARSTRDFFNLGFGGTPVLLAPALFWAQNPVLQRCNRLISFLYGSIHNPESPINQTP